MLERENDQSIKRYMTCYNKKDMLLHENFSTEVAATLDSIRGLLLLAERYQNHPETKNCLDLVLSLIMRLEQGIGRAGSGLN